MKVLLNDIGILRILRVRTFLFYFVLFIVDSTQGQQYYKEIASPLSKGRRSSIGFEINGKGYFGLGYDSTLTEFNDFWEYDPALNKWSKKASYPGIGRSANINFVINGKAYVGIGEPENAGQKPTDFWEYNPQKDTWIRKADFLGGYRQYPVSFSISNYGYVGLGFYNKELIDIWKYDVFNDTWIQMRDFPGLGRSSASAIGTPGFALLGLGLNFDQIEYMDDIWRYNPNLDTWIMQSNYPKGKKASQVAFMVSGKIYLGLGFLNNVGNDNDIYEYDSLNDAWTYHSTLPSTGGWYASAAFGLNGMGIICTGGVTSFSNSAKFWSFHPSGLNLNKAALHNYTVFPNPSTGLLYVSGISNVNNQIKIFTLSGCLIQEINYEVIKSDYLEIDCSKLRKGIYIIQVNNDINLVSIE